MTATTQTQPTIRTLVPGSRWAVASQSEPNTERLVVRFEGNLTCDCPGCLWRGTCRHIKAVNDAVFSDAARIERIRDLVKSNNPLMRKSA